MQQTRTVHVYIARRVRKASTTVELTHPLITTFSASRSELWFGGSWASPKRLLSLVRVHTLLARVIRKHPTAKI